MTKLLYAASAAAMLTVAGHLPAMAQSSQSGMSAPMITCRDITTMDRDTARSVVFYVSGFHAASGAMQNQASGLSGSSGSNTTDTTTGSSGSTTADAGSGSSGSGATDATGSSDATSGSTAADAGSGSTSSDTTGSTSSAGGTASGANSGASSAVVAQLPGFNAIDIDRIMTECASSPDRQISEMVGMGASGSGTGTTTP
jgi:hypothetical protein